MRARSSSGPILGPVHVADQFLVFTVVVILTGNQSMPETQRYGGGRCQSEGGAPCSGDRLAAPEWYDIAHLQPQRAGGVEPAAGRVGLGGISRVGGPEKGVIHPGEASGGRGRCSRWSHGEVEARIRAAARVLVQFDGHEIQSCSQDSGEVHLQGGVVSLIARGPSVQIVGIQGRGDG